MQTQAAWLRPLGLPAPSGGSAHRGTPERVKALRGLRPQFSQTASPPRHSIREPVSDPRTPPSVIRDGLLCARCRLRNREVTKTGATRWVWRGTEHRADASAGGENVPQRTPHSRGRRDGEETCPVGGGGPEQDSGLSGTLQAPFPTRKVEPREGKPLPPSMFIPI